MFGLDSLSQTADFTDDTDAAEEIRLIREIRGDISTGKIKRAGSVAALPARANDPDRFRPGFQQRTHTSWRSIRSQPAVSRRLFRCLGHTSCEALDL
jgi:hypothetical protein